MGDSAWLDRLLLDAELGHIPQLIANADPSARFVADDASFEVMSAALSRARLPNGRLIRARHFPVSLMLNFDIRRVVVVDALDEDAALKVLQSRLKAEATPEPILQTMRFETFVADWLPRAALATGPEDRSVEVLGDVPRLLYAIVSAPRAGSTFLAGLLSSVCFGRPVEHLRPWMVELVRDRPAGLFDGIRFLQTIICLSSENAAFGTKLISHFIDDVLPHLTSAERSYLRELMGRFRIIYLVRQNKLDQAISSIQARRTGVWHVTDPAARAPPNPNDPVAGHAEIAWEIEQRTIQETMLAAWMADLPSHLLVTYEELSRSPEATAGKIAEYFGLTIPSLPKSNYIKLSDAATQQMRTAFMAATDMAGPPETLAVDLLRAARDTAAGRRAEMERRSRAIREGHAASKAGDYQDRHYYLLDYKSTHIPGLVFPCRGPVPAQVDEGGYLAFLGAAQTFGAFIHQPFPDQVGQRLNREVLNLGRGGGGPSFFTALPRVMELVGRAGAVVVQVMAARMVSNSRFESLEGRAAVHYLEADGTRVVMDCEQAWTRALAEGGAPLVKRLVEESRANWVAHMRKIARSTSRPSVMFYFSSVEPDHETGFADLGDIYGEYPQLVTRAMIDEVRPAFSAYAEVISSAGLPEATVSSFSGERLPVVFGGGSLDEQNVLGQNTYYPSQPMHDEAAEVLTKVLRPLLS